MSFRFIRMTRATRRAGPAIVLLSLSATVIGCGSADRPEVTAETIETTTPVADGNLVSFRFDEDGPLGASPTDSWVSVVGSWESRAGALMAVSGDVDDVALATLPVGASDGFLQVTLESVANQAGLVFRFSNPDNYWYVTVAPDFGSWNVVKVIDGKRKPVGDVGVAPVGDTTSVGVFLNGPDITVMLNGQTFDTLTDRTHMDATTAGVLVGWNAGDSPATFDDFLVLGIDQGGTE